MPNTTGITRRITLLAWSVTLATLSIFVAIIIPEQKKDLRAELESKASGVVVSLKGEVASASISEDYSSVVDHAMQVLAGDPSVDFLVITKSGGYSIIIQRTGWRTETKNDAYWLPKERKPVGEIGVVPLFGKRLFHYAVPFDHTAIEWGWIHVGLSLDSYDSSARRVYLRTGIIAVVCVLLGLGVSVSFAGRFVRPILLLKSLVEKVANGDLSVRADVRSNDEIEELADAFNTMADSILFRDQALSEAKRDLERRVTERTQELREQIKARDSAHAQLAEAQQRLMELSRLSGMAEVATGVLHNVGNVLNSVNISASMLADGLHSSRVNQFRKLVGLLDENQAHLGTFLTVDPRGQRIMPYMNALVTHLEQEQAVLIREVSSLVQHINHIKEIVSMQQTYARASGVYEKVLPSELIADVLNISRDSLQQHGIHLHRDFEDLPPITTDRHRVLQILLNLLGNAKDAVKASGRKPREISIVIRRKSEDRVFFEVADNGVGIDPDHLIKIFSHGFTTKQNGHGFGLHSGSLAAGQLGGILTAHSDGLGKGARFCLELPENIRNVQSEGCAS